MHLKKRFSYRKKTPRYQPTVCEKALTFEECELSILRQVVDESEKRQGAKVAMSPEVMKIVEIVEQFLRKKKLICYGGTAINNILPKKAQFYDRATEIPDYDFFSMHPLSDAKELADLYYAKGYDEVEAKAGVHVGTYKVYVNFIPVADITLLHPSLYKALEHEAIRVAGIRYAPPNYLRMAMFLELSRPEGDVSRWEKVLKRINLLNRFYPLRQGKPCNPIHFQRPIGKRENVHKSEALYTAIRTAFADQGLVFLGGYGTLLYSKYMPENQRRQVEKIPDFDVLAENPVEAAKITKDQLHDLGFRNVELIQHTAVGEVVPEHVELRVNGDTLAFLYKPLGCHSYNQITVDEQEINVATIDTMLSFYLAFIYADKPYFNRDRILCMAMYLFEVEQKNRLAQKGLLKRFPISCYGKQETLEEIRANKAKKYSELKSAKDQTEFNELFFKYDPRKNPEAKRENKNDEEESKPITKSYAIRSIDPDSIRKRKATRKTHVVPRKRTKTQKQIPNKKEEAEEGPYARRDFVWG